MQPNAITYDGYSRIGSGACYYELTISNASSHQVLVCKLRHNVWMSCLTGRLAVRLHDILPTLDQFLIRGHHTDLSSVTLVYYDGNGVQHTLGSLFDLPANTPVDIFAKNPSETTLFCCHVGVIPCEHTSMVQNILPSPVYTSANLNLSTAVLNTSSAFDFSSNISSFSHGTSYQQPAARRYNTIARPPALNTDIGPCQPARPRTIPQPLTPISAGTSMPQYLRERKSFRSVIKSVYDLIQLNTAIQAQLDRGTVTDNRIADAVMRELDLSRTRVGELRRMYAKYCYYSNRGHLKQAIDNPQASLQTLQQALKRIEKLVSFQHEALIFDSGTTRSSTNSSSSGNFANMMRATDTTNSTISNMSIMVPQYNDLRNGKSPRTIATPITPIAPRTMRPNVQGYYSGSTEHDLTPSSASKTRTDVIAAAAPPAAPTLMKRNLEPSFDVDTTQPPMKRNASMAADWNTIDTDFLEPFYQPLTPLAANTNYQTFENENSTTSAFMSQPFPTTTNARLRAESLNYSSDNSFGQPSLSQASAHTDSSWSSAPQASSQPLAEDFDEDNDNARLPPDPVDDFFNFLL